MNKLKQYRLLRGLTQTEACKLIGITNPQMTRYENNRQLPKVNTIYKMAEVYKVAPEEIFLALPRNRYGN